MPVHRPQLPRQLGARLGGPFLQGAERAHRGAVVLGRSPYLVPGNGGGPLVEAGGQRGAGGGVPEPEGPPPRRRHPRITGASGAIALADVIKPSAVEAIGELHAMGLSTLLLTGDNAATARAVADQVGIDDAPALARADLGLAVVEGTDVAQAAADLILVRDDLNVLPTALTLARATLATIRGNLAWAFGYNVAALPLAAAGLLNPLIAGAAMALSSVFVVTNSLRLRRFAPAAARADFLAGHVDDLEAHSPAAAEPVRQSS
ncbi:HAD family hydrolase [Nonomuraea sp. C10]|nr:HAD family hydrolase [Nonomuraea sp. C10]